MAMISKFSFFKQLRAFMAVSAIVSAAAAPAGAEPLTLYTSMPEVFIRQTLEAFSKTHPDIEISLFRGGSTKVVGKVLAEAAAGQVLADAIMVADDISMQELKQQDLLSPYPDAPVAGLPAGAFDKDLTYFGTKRMSVVLAYNPDKVQAAPNSWKEITNAPEGQVIMANPLTSGSALAHLWWMVSTFDWPIYEALSLKNARVDPSNRAVWKAVAEGDATYGMVLDYVAAQGVRTGGAARFVYPAEGAVTMHQPIAIPKGARHPKAARALIDFMLSAEGQKLVVQQGYRSLLPDGVIPDGYPDLDESRLTAVDAEAAVRDATQLRDVFDALFGK